MLRKFDPDDYGLVVYFLFTLGAIFIGPLEAVLGLAGYWLFTAEETDSGRQGSGTR
jgi:hypothetical protein